MAGKLHAQNWNGFMDGAMDGAAPAGSGRSPGGQRPLLPVPGSALLVPAGKAPGAPGKLTQLIPLAWPESLQAGHQQPFHSPAASTRRAPFLCVLSFGF